MKRFEKIHLKTSMESFLSGITNLAAQHATRAVSDFISSRTTQVQNSISGNPPPTVSFQNETVEESGISNGARPTVASHNETVEKLQIQDFDPEELKKALLAVLDENPEAVRALIQQWDPQRVAAVVRQFNQINPKGTKEEKIQALTKELLDSKHGQSCCTTWIWILVIIIFALLLWWLWSSNKKKYH